MCDFVDVLNLLLDRVSINSFLFRVPKKSVLFSLSTYPSYILHNAKSASSVLPLYKNLPNALSQKYNLDEVEASNSRNKKMYFVPPPLEKNIHSVCLNKITEELLLFNNLKFYQYFSGDLKTIYADNNLIYVGIKDGKFQTSYELKFDFYLIYGENNDLHVTDDLKYADKAYIFNTSVAFKNYNVSSETDEFRWIEIIFYFENKLRNLFNKVNINNKYISAPENVKKINYVIDGEKMYTPIEGYIEKDTTDRDNTYYKETMLDYYIFLERTQNVHLPIVNVINYDKFVETEYVFQANSSIDENIANYYKKYCIKLQHSFDMSQPNESFMKNQFPFFKYT